MSKKDKEKDRRKKGDGPREDAFARRPDERAEPSGPMTRRSNASPSTGEEEIIEGHLPPLRPVIIDGKVSEDVSEESQADIAPIGPTEYVGAVSSSVAPESVPAPTAARPPPSVQHLEQQIRDLEARLDEMIARGGPGSAAPAPGHAATVPTLDVVPTISTAGEQGGEAQRSSVTVPAAAPWATAKERPGLRPPQGPPVTVVQPEPIDEPEGRATARDLLPNDFYLRQWGRAGRRRRAEEVDEFGHDPKYEARFLPFFDFLHKTYFRVEAEGVENIPAEGRCLLVGNHSGGPLPYDGIMLRTTVRREHPAQREVRWLAEDFVYYLPFVGTAMNRLGAVRACQENAERLLDRGHLVAVFPEGAKGIGKLFKDRYRLQRFGRGGFIRLCLRTRTPIVPAAIVGAEEANPMLYRIEYLTKTLGIPYFPITPTFPALGPLGLLPAPTKWKVTFGEPIDFAGYGPEAADDDLLVGRLSDRVRATIQSMLDRTLAGRQSVWFG